MSEHRGVIVRETDKAFCVDFQQEEPVWIPKSQIRVITKGAPDRGGRRECVLEIPDWLAEKNGL